MIPGLIRVADAVSTAGDLDAAVAEVVGEVRERVGVPPDLALVYFTAHHRDHASRLLAQIQMQLSPDALAGCTVSGVIGGGHEHQAGPGLAVMAARLPGTGVQAFRLGFDEEASMVRGWPDAGEDASVILLVDPFTFPVDPFFDSLRRGHRVPAMTGGLASGATRAGGNLLLMDDEVVDEGAVGLALQGSVRLENFVSQGCRAIGPVFEITRCDRNVVYELEGKSAYEELSDVLSTLDDGERRRFMRAPHVGIRAVRSTSGEEAADFLVRGVMGVDPDKGAIAITDHLEDGRALQFQARDRESAHDDLDDALSLASAYHPDAAGALVFSCTGRGLPLFQRADHDVESLHRFWPELPAAGFFAAGEIGPVCGAPYVHGLSASIGLLVPNQE